MIDYPKNERSLAALRDDSLCGVGGPSLRDDPEILPTSPRIFNF